MVAHTEARRPPEPAAAFSVVMIGRMVVAKDFKAVIAAARLLQREQRPCKFLLVGHGHQRDRLIAEAGGLIADGVVTFPAPGIEVLDYVRRAQVGVLITDPRWHQEGCSKAIMEYMACGLLVACNEGGGNRKLVVDGKTGFVIPPADPQTLAERIAYLREHEAEGRAMGEAGRNRIADTFSVERMVDGFVRIYREALAAYCPQGTVDVAPVCYACDAGLWGKGTGFLERGATC